MHFPTFDLSQQVEKSLLADIYIYIFHFCSFIDIQRRLGELGNKGRPTGGEDSAQLLAELRAQEERNQRALDDLKRQLYDINHQRINVM